MSTQQAFPRTAFVSLWFPKPSETFVYREVLALWRMGLPVRVFCLYGALTKGLSREMLETGIPVERLGLAAAPQILADVWQSLRFAPGKTCAILAAALGFSAWGLRSIPVALVKTLLRAPKSRDDIPDFLASLWSSLFRGFEQFGENLLAAMCGFTLARRCREEGMEQLHAAWANGSATAAWVVNRLTGIPFGFTARAGDVHPPDGLLGLKLRACSFARVDSAYNLPHLRALIPDAPGKVHLVYNARTMVECPEAAVAMRAPVRLLGVGRFVATKGFQILIEALALLRGHNIDVRLTLAGDDPAGKPRLPALAAALGLEAYVDFPGLVPHDKLSQLYADSDILVMPSIVQPNGDSDGLPTVINEALYHRLPVVATNVASIPDVIKDRQTGLLVPERDAAALAGAIAFMIRHRDQAVAMAEAGRALALSMFDPDTCIGKMRKLLEGGEDREGTPF